MRIYKPLLSLALLISLSACQSDGPQAADPSAETTQSAEAAEAEAEAQPAADEPLQRAVGRIFGLPLPEGLDLVQRDDDVAHFTSPHSRDLLEAFYREELSGFDVEARADGVRFGNSDETGADLYVVQSDGDAAGSAIDVYYIQAAIDVTELIPSSESANAGGDPVDPRTLPFAERYPWPQGPVAPPEVVERLQPPPQGEVPGGGEYYEERYEEVDGEQVRVLTVRENGEPERAVEAPPTQVFPENWNRLPRTPGGSYDRGDGHRSLRATPALGPDGRPLPYVGNRQHDIDDTDAPH